MRKIAPQVRAAPLIIPAAMYPAAIDPENVPNGARPFSARHWRRYGTWSRIYSTERSYIRRAGSCYKKSHAHHRMMIAPFILANAS